MEDMKTEILNVFQEKKVRVESSCLSNRYFILVLANETKERKLRNIQKILEKRGFNVSYLAAEHLCCIESLH